MRDSETGNYPLLTLFTILLFSTGVIARVFDITIAKSGCSGSVEEYL